jgi:hypothetical protein
VRAAKDSAPRVARVSGSRISMGWL